MGLVSAWAGAGSGCSPVQSQCHWAERLLQRWLCTYLQECVELLLFLPIHIAFLKELEIGDEAPTWSDIPTRNVLMWVPKRGAQGSEMRGRDRTGRGCWESGFYSIVASGSQ